MQHTAEEKAKAARGRVTPLVAMAIARNLDTGAYEDLSHRHDWPVLTDFDLRGRIPICVGAGPSLDLNGEELRGADPERFAIFATDSAIRWLLERDIRIDGACTSELEGATSRKDPTRPGTEPLIWGIEERCTFPLFAPYQANTDFVKAWRGPIYWYVDCGYRYEKWWTMAPSLWPADAARAIVRPQFLLCGGHLIACCEAMGAKEIILLGYDWQVEDGDHHCTGYPVSDPGGAANRYKMDLNYRQWHSRGARWTAGEVRITNCTAKGRFPQDAPLAERLRR